VIDPPAPVSELATVVIVLPERKVTVFCVSSVILVAAKLEPPFVVILPPSRPLALALINTEAAVRVAPTSTKPLIVAPPKTKSELLVLVNVTEVKGMALSPAAPMLPTSRFVPVRESVPEPWLPVVGAGPNVKPAPLTFRLPSLDTLTVPANSPAPLPLTSNSRPVGPINRGLVPLSVTVIVPPPPPAAAAALNNALPAPV